MAVLYQIYYAQEHLKELYPCATPYFNDKLTIFFENSVIKELVSTTTADKISVCSWKLRQKQRYYIGRPRPITQQVLDSDYQVLSFTKQTQYHVMLSAAKVWHPNFLEMFDRMLQIIGKTRPHEVKNPIYQNHFSATREIYGDYVRRYLSPAMEAIENDKGLNSMALADSNYSNLTKESAAHLKDKIGIDYFPMAPFLLERLFSVYCHNEKIKITYNDQQS